MRTYTSRISVGLLLLSVLFCGCFRQERSPDTAHASAASHALQLNSVDDLYQFLTYREDRIPLVSAHRGGPQPGYPENAIATFQNIAQNGPLIIECDIAMSSDSVLVLMHDETLNRTSTGTGKVNSYTLEQLQELYLKDPDGETTNYRIPTLEEALTWGVGKVIFTLDVKRNVPYSKVVEVIRETATEPYSIMITYSADQAAVVHSLAPDLMISAPIKHADDLVRLNDRDVPDTRLVAFLGTKEAAKSTTDLLHQHGILCILGTMGNLDRQAQRQGYQKYAEYIERGADIISTDQPELAAKALDYYIQKRRLSSPFIH